MTCLPSTARHLVRARSTSSTPRGRWVAVFTPARWSGASTTFSRAATCSSGAHHRALPRPSHPQDSRKKPGPTTGPGFSGKGLSLEVHTAHATGRVAGGSGGLLRLVGDDGLGG